MAGGQPPEIPVVARVQAIGLIPDCQGALDSMAFAQHVIGFELPHTEQTAMAVPAVTSGEEVHMRVSESHPAISTLWPVSIDCRSASATRSPAAASRRVRAGLQ